MSGLAWIPGQIIELRFGAGRSLPGWEPEPEGAPVPPGDRGLQVGESGVDEGGVVAAQVQRAGEAGVVDVHERAEGWGTFSASKEKP